MELLLGGLAGAASGLVAGLICAITQITYKRMRNARYIRRGEAPAKDVMLTPFWIPFAILGLMAGFVGCIFTGTWTTGVIAGAALPAFGTVCWLGAALAQLRR